MSDTASQRIADSGSPEAAPVGAKLAARRIEMGMSVEEVAGRMNLAVRQIHAIESGDYPHLPNLANTRGFIRAYAKLVQLDAEPLLEEVAREYRPADVDTSLRKPVSAKPFYTGRDRPVEKSLRKPAFMVVLALVVLTAVWAWRSGLFPSDRELSGSEGEMASGAGFDGGGRKADRQDEADQPLSAQGSRLEDDAERAQVLAAFKTQAPVTATSENQLVLTMREQSWIEIRDAKDRVLISRLIPAGENFSFDVDAPISVVIGNATGVDAVLRGKSLEMARSARNNVVKLDLK